MAEWEYLTVHELAELFQVHPQTVRNWLTAGQLEFTKLGRRVRIPRQAAVAFAGGEGWEIPELKTVDQVAEQLLLNPQTLRNWIIDGKLPAVYLGQRRVRIKQSVVDDLLASGLSGLQAPKGPAPSASDFWLGTVPVGEPVFAQDLTNS
jgi:excisionase family DNA binding protein